MTHVTCRLTAKNRDQLRNPTLGNRVWATFTFFSHTQACSRLLHGGAEEPCCSQSQRVGWSGCGVSRVLGGRSSATVELFFGGLTAHGALKKSVMQ